MLIQWPVAFFGGLPGGGEVLLILLAMLLLFGAKKLPQMARTLGRTLEEFRRATREVSDEIMRAGEPDEPAARPPIPPALQGEHAPPGTESRNAGRADPLDEGEESKGPGEKA